MSMKGQYAAGWIPGLSVPDSGEVAIEPEGVLSTDGVNALMSVAAGEPAMSKMSMWR